MIILNFLPSSGGGGLQNICSFIAYISTIDNKAKLVAVVRRGTTEYDLIRNTDIKMMVIGKSLIARFLAELAMPRRWPGSVCFTFWGPPPIFARGRMVNVIGVALSNLFHPQINFWGHLAPPSRFYKRLKDWYRFRSLSLADILIFETEYLKDRAKCMLPEKEMLVVRMAPTINLIKPDKYEVSPLIKHDSSKRFKILMLNPSHPNKRQHLLPQLLASLSVLCPSIKVYTTMGDDSYSREVISQWRRLGLDSMITNLGRVPYDEISPLIVACDAMINLSVLESFTNNIIEAWFHKKLLFITNAEWARDSCGAGAVYIDPTEPESCAGIMYEMIQNELKRKEVIHAGSKLLATYPSMTSKNKTIIEILEKYDYQI